MQTQVSTRSRRVPGDLLGRQIRRTYMLFIAIHSSIEEIELVGCLDSNVLKSNAYLLLRYFDSSDTVQSGST